MSSERIVATTRRRRRRSPNQQLGTPPTFNLSLGSTSQCSTRIGVDADDTMNESFGDENSPKNSLDFHAEQNRLIEEVQVAIDKICVAKPSKTKLKLKVNKITLTSAWKWRDSKDDDPCGICRNAFEATCVNCKMPGDLCPIVLGNCSHAFHLHCINEWFESQSTPSCPLCRTQWENTAVPPNYTSP